MKVNYKLIATSIALIIAGFSSNAQITVPSASSKGSVSATVGLTEIKIDYFRPKMKGRKIFGSGESSLAPFGQLWRSGANSGTIVSTDKDIKVEGKDLPAGEYLLLTIPNENEWTVIFYKDKSIGGTMNKHKVADEQVRVKVKAAKRTETIELLTYNVADISEDNKTAAIELAWENTSVKIGIEVAFDDIIMAQIAKHTQVNPGNLMQAANYYYQTNRDLDQALAWAEFYIKDHPKQFWNILLKAKIQAKLGDKKGAKATAKQCLAVAEANEGGDYGYVKLSKNLIKSL